MAAVVVTAQNTRLDDAETLTDWGVIGGGPAGGLETDYKYQGSNCRSRKGASSSRGIFLSDNVDSDLSGTGTYETILFKFIVTTPGLLDLISVPGLQLRIGSGSIPATPSVDYYSYDIHGSDTYPVDKSWLILAIDPNIASHRDGTTGTPVLTVVDFYALMVDQTGVSKAENYALDAVDIGAGLTLTGGDGADPDGVWQDFSDHDLGTVNNRFGYVREAEGAFVIYGNMIIGTATAAVFQDTGAVVIFSEGLFAAGFSAITIDLQSATTDIDFITCTFLSEGTSAGEDTRPLFVVTGTAGAFDATTCLFDNFASFALTSATTLRDCTILTSGQIDAGSGADLGGTAILTSAVAANTSALLWNVNLDPDGELDDMTFSVGTNAHHAIEFGLTSPLTMTLRGQTYTGFNAANANNDSTFHVKRTSGTVTINIIDGVGNTSFRTDGATVNIVISPVTSTVNVLDNTGADLQNARVLLRASDGTGDLLFNAATSSLTQSAGTATCTTSAVHGLTTNDFVVITGAAEEEYNIQAQVTVTSTTVFTYAVDSGATTPAGGTPLVTGALISGLTDVNGEIADTRSWSNPQPVVGYARKSTSTPFFKSSPLAGTVSTSTGLNLQAQLILDE